MRHQSTMVIAEDDDELAKVLDTYGDGFWELVNVVWMNNWYIFFKRSD